MSCTWVGNAEKYVEDWSSSPSSWYLVQSHTQIVLAEAEEQEESQ